MTTCLSEAWLQLRLLLHEAEAFEAKTHIVLLCVNDELRVKKKKIIRLSGINFS